MTDRPRSLRNAFTCQSTMCLPQIMQALACSRRTAIRALSALGYLSSYSHTGRFYSIPSVAQFDALGLWHNRDMHFSRWGTLKKTVRELLERSPAGYDHRELQELTRVRCYNVLLDLTTHGQVHRQRLGLSRGGFYFSTDLGKRTRQVTERQRLMNQQTEWSGRREFPPPPIDPSQALAMVVELVRSPQATPAVIAHGLQKDYGLAVTVADVRGVFRTYDLDKKRAP